MSWVGCFGAGRSESRPVPRRDRARGRVGLCPPTGPKRDRPSGAIIQHPGPHGELRNFEGKRPGWQKYLIFRDFRLESAVKSGAKPLKTTASFPKTTASFAETTASFAKTTASFPKTTASFLKTIASFPKTIASFLKTTASFPKTIASLRHSGGAFPPPGHPRWQSATHRLATAAMCDENWREPRHRRGWERSGAEKGKENFRLNEANGDHAKEKNRVPDFELTREWDEGRTDYSLTAPAAPAPRIPRSGRAFSGRRRSLR